MLKLCTKLPREISVAVSGGSDSMCALDFLRKNHKIRHVLFYHYGSKFNSKCLYILRDYCAEHGLSLLKEYASFVPPTNREKVWRDMRYSFFAANNEVPIVLGHTLDDVVETYIGSTLKGKTKLIEVNGPSNTVRPFLFVTKRQTREYCLTNGISFVDDPSNEDFSLERTVLRHRIVPECLRVNPGLYKTVKKLLAKKLEGKK